MPFCCRTRVVIGRASDKTMAVHEPDLSSGAYPGVPVMDAKAEPTLKYPESEAFYAEALKELNQLGLPYLLAGTYALSAYTGITRTTKDLDIFCKAGDYPRVLSHFKNLGYAIEIEDERWEVLLMHLLNFRWIYPTERDNVPRWVMDELLDRLAKQLELPPPQMKVCRGRMFSRVDYEIDVKAWGFADVGGEGEWRND